MVFVLWDLGLMGEGEMGDISRSELRWAWPPMCTV